MKRILIALIVLALCAGCGGGPTEGTIILPYPKPSDFSHFEVFVGLSSGFPVTGWNGSAWASEPNAPADWDGVTNTLKVVSSTEPIAIPGVTPGVRYYVRVVAVDTSNNRSAPSAQYDAVAGGAPRAATVIVAASDASPASKAGADYVCDGTDDHVEIAAALNAVAAVKGKVALTEGTFIVNDYFLIPSGVTVEGQGISTVVTFKDGYEGGNRAIFYADYYAENVTIKNMMLDGNQQGITLGNQRGVEMTPDNNNIILTDLIIKNFRGPGILITCHKVSIRNCVITGNGSVFGGGVFLQDVKEIIMSQNEIYDNKEYGVYINSARDSIFSNNHISRNQFDGFVLSGSTIRAENNQVCNNQCTGNGVAQNNTYSNILIYNFANRNIIQGNVCRAGDAANKPKYGIRIQDNSCTANVITNNDCFESGVTAGISNAGTNTSFGAGNRNNNGTWSTTPN